jgi:hypothetical protein
MHFSGIPVKNQLAASYPNVLTKDDHCHGRIYEIVRRMLADTSAMSSSGRFFSSYILLVTNAKKNTLDFLEPLTMRLGCPCHEQEGHDQEELGMSVRMGCQYMLLAGGTSNKDWLSILRPEET